MTSKLFYFWLLIWAFSCHRDIDPVKTVSYLYRNQTGYSLEMHVFNEEEVLIKSFSIANNNEIVTNTTSMEVPALFFFDSSKSKIGDSIVINFEDQKCLYFDKYNKNKDELFRIESYDNYSPQLLNKSEYRLIYTFTTSHKEKAKECHVH